MVPSDAMHTVEEVRAHLVAEGMAAVVVQHTLLGQRMLAEVGSMAAEVVRWGSQQAGRAAVRMAAVGTIAVRMAAAVGTVAAHMAAAVRMAAAVHMAAAVGRPAAVHMAGTPAEPGMLVDCGRRRMAWTTRNLCERSW